MHPLPLMCLTLLALAAPPEAPSGLLVNLLSRPEKSVITDPQPDFGWIVPATAPGDIQTACQILVATSAELLAAGTGDMWDSGRLQSAQSVNVAYAGRPLEPGTSYWWAVRTWNRAGEASPYSAPQRFLTGEFARERGWPGESLWTQLEDEAGRPFWGFEDRHPIEYHEVAPAAIKRREDGSHFIDFGRASFSTLRLTLDWRPRAADAAGSATIELVLGEKRKGDAVDPEPGGGIIHRIVPLAIEPGLHTYTVQFPRFKPRYPHSQPLPAHMPEVIPFRYCEVNGGGLDLSLEDARQLALYYQFDDDAADFDCSSAELKQIYDLCRYSIKVNTFNGDYAASERERMLYEADSFIHQMGHYAVDREYAIARYSTRNMIYHATWPAEWISHAILMAWADYLHTGNRKLIAGHYEDLRAKTMLALANDDGLISTRTGLQTPEFLHSIHLAKGQLKDIVDWPTTEADEYEFSDFNTVVNAFHYHSLVLMSRIAAKLGKREDAAFYRERAERSGRAIHASMFDPERGIYVDGVGSRHASLHANLFPLVFGLVPEDCRAGVVEYVKSRGMACGVYPAHYLLEALYDAGEEQAALDLMLAEGDRGWLNMLRVGSTITTEAWDVKYKKNQGWTHAWSSSPAHIIPRKLMGIEPLEPGFGRIRIKPRPGNLTWAETRLPTIRGTVRARLEQQPGRSFTLEVEIPANMSARIELPAPGGADAPVRLNGETVKSILEGDRIVIERVGSGTHRLTVGEGEARH